MSRSAHALLLALLGSLAGATIARADPGDSLRGRAIYEGRIALPSATGGPAPGCMLCHRRSGMGDFEGGLAVPPIAGPMLFSPLDRDSARYFAHSEQFRVRPAYDEVALGVLLREGRAPDGTAMRPAMPRYDIGAQDLADLRAYLQGLSASPPGGIDAQSIRLATITTPDADPVRRDAMLAALERFVERKNAQSRHEAKRSAQADRTREMVADRKFRLWTLEHWALEGAPASWAAQLEGRQAHAPVYAVVAGMGGVRWSAVDDFCERHRLPCLLPQVEASPPEPASFYSLRFHGGIEVDARLLAEWLRGAPFRLRAAPRGDAQRAALVRQALVGAGAREAGVADASDEVVQVSLLAPPAHLDWLRGEQARGRIAWLPGSTGLTPAALQAVTHLMPDGLIVTSSMPGVQLDRQLQRARTWARAQGLADVPDDVVANAVFAAMALGDGLAHSDFGFTPEYLIERLEHGLENLVPWSTYPRLAIGPGQRVASKGSYVGTIRAGQVSWQWTRQP